MLTVHHMLSRILNFKIRSCQKTGSDWLKMSWKLGNLGLGICEKLEIWDWEFAKTIGE